MNLRNDSPRGGAWRAGAVLLALAAAGCAGYGPGALQPGAREAEVRALMGPPTGERTAPDGGRRLEYARGPMGLHTWMLDLDGDGRVRRITQVMQPAAYEAVREGDTQADVLNRLGRPAQRQAVGWRGHVLWSWRYDNPFCRWFQLEFDPAGQVVGGGFYGPDPRCEDRSDPWLK